MYVCKCIVAFWQGFVKFALPEEACFPDGDIFVRFVKICQISQNLRLYSDNVIICTYELLRVA